MNKEKLPIKFFLPRDADESKNEPGGRENFPAWILSGSDLEQRAVMLWKDINQFSSFIEEREKRNSAIPFVFVAKMNRNATAKTHRAKISSLFQVGNRNNIIGLSDSDELVVKIHSSNDLSKISKRLSDFEQNRYAISCIESVQKFEPAIEEASEKSAYKVKLIDFQDSETNIYAQRLFESALASRKIEFKKTRYTPEVPIYKLSLSPDVILDALHGDDAFSTIFSIEEMPKYFIGFNFFKGSAPFEIPMPDPGKRYEILGILDSGIANIDPLLPWKEGERWAVYPESEIDSIHGTFVAGVAICGDCFEHQHWVGHRGIKLFDAVIAPDSRMIEEDELIENIREAVSLYHETVKVWNLSSSVKRPVSDKKFSDFAMALDDLQTKYNVLICKSAGNCDNFILSRHQGRIHEGADSVRSLVVGSVAHAKGPYDLAEIDNLSPFSRIGPGPEFIIKPEVVHYGGNAGLDENGEVVLTGVISLSNNGDLATNIGTSFSTPRVASLATGLYQEIEGDFDPLLLKGLIIHSASYPNNLQIPETERTNQVGFGIPKNIQQILFNEPHEITLILRGTLAKGRKIDIMDFPMPRCLIRDGYYTGQIIATLVYDPILDPTQGAEYCQSNIDIKFGTFDQRIERDTERWNVINPVGRKGAQNLLLDNNYSMRLRRGNQSDFALRERLLIRYSDKYYPVKKYAVDLSEMTDTNKRKYTTGNKLWFLYLDGIYRDHTVQRARIDGVSLSQEFCLMLTIRDPEHSANVYDEVTQGLANSQFWHRNINLSSDVSVSVDSD